MAVDAFLKLWSQGNKPVVGESADSAMGGAIEITEFTLDSLSLGRKKKKKDKEGNEKESGSKQMFTLKVSKDFDQSSAMLAQSYSLNRATPVKKEKVQPFEKAVLYVRKPGAVNFFFLEITFLGIY